MLVLNFGNQSVGIDAGELVSYKVDAHEYIHQKGSAGWSHSDTEMFPIIGPTSNAKFQVETPRDIAILDQHGLLRELDYEVVSQSESSIVFRKNYKARTAVANSKYPEKSNKKFLFWTYDFQFEKQFELTENGLEITFTVSGEKDTPFMLGYHPAFNLVTKNPIIIAEEKAITLAQVLAVGSKAFSVLGYEEVVLKDKNELKISTSGFGNFMLWTEVPNMICIEPITFYPYAVSQEKLHEGFQYLKNDTQKFSVQLSVVG